MANGILELIKHDICSQADFIEFLNKVDVNYIDYFKFSDMSFS